MPEPGSASSGTKDPDSSSEGGRIWRGLRTLLFGEQETSLREELEHALEEYEDDDAGKPVKGDLTPVEREMIKNLLHFSENSADDVAVPRGEIVAISQDASFDDLVNLFVEHGHSRVPVYKDSLDTITGMIHIRDAFAILAEGRDHPASLTDLMRQPLYVPQSMGVLDLLADMRAKRTHLAIVVDEYSGTDGLVTIEDLVEEIVGDIEDEHDDEPEAMLIACTEGCWEADARAELEEVAELVDAAFADVEEDVDTLGGLAFVLAGHVPSPGEIIMHEPSGWRLEVLDSDGRRVTRLRLHPPATAIAEE
jgi:CBS domain containing-hemolysin-like protein